MMNFERMLQQANFAILNFGQLYVQLLYLFIFTTLNKKFKSGISQTVLYYTTGLVIAGLVFILYGKNLKSFPGPHHIIIFTLSAGGIIWMFYYYALSLAKQKYKINFGSLTVHLLFMIALIITALVYII